MENACFKVKINFQVERIVKAQDEEAAANVFGEKYEEELAANNEMLGNKVWESVETEKVKCKESEIDYRE